MTTSQSDKAARLRALHEGPRAFVIANPWDAGSARVLTGQRPLNVVNPEVYAPGAARRAR